jgi:hypothetical protein
VWSYNGEEVKHPLAGYYGFCYRITNLIDQRQYLGRKTFFFRKKNSKGQRITIESDWKQYYGSSQELLADIELYGKENFKREILSFHQSKSDLNYAETKLLFQNSVLESEDFYNRNIMNRYFSSRIRNIESRSMGQSQLPRC